jgi:monooxygenase
VSVDGKPFKPNDEVGYKGIMLSNLPNAASVFGYINASWTLKADLVSEYICRVLNHMDKTGMRQCTPRLDPAVEQVPMVDMSSGYFQRALHKFPKQGSKSPWRFYHNYALDIGYFRLSRVEDGVMTFTNPDPAAATKKPAPLRKLVSALGL